MYLTQNNQFVKTFSHENHVVKSFFKPGLFSADILPVIKKDIDKINQNTLKLNYGIFDSKNDFKEICKNFLISIIYKGEEPVGFFYDYIIDEEHVHFGLVVIEKNSGVDLVVAPRMFTILWLKELLNKNFYGTFLTSIPKIVEAVGDSYYNAWPTEKNYYRLINKKYKTVVEKVFSEYIVKFFPFPESLKVDSKRFVLISEAKEMGFERNIKHMPLAKNLMVNLFCNFWLDYNKNEDLFQVIEVDNQLILNLKNNFPEISEKYENAK